MIDRNREDQDPTINTPYGVPEEGQETLVFYTAVNNGACINMYSNCSTSQVTADIPDPRPFFFHSPRMDLPQKSG